MIHLLTVVAIPLIVFPWFVGIVDLAGRYHDRRIDITRAQDARDVLRSKSRVLS